MDSRRNDILNNNKNGIYKTFNFIFGNVQILWDFVCLCVRAYERERELLKKAFFEVDFSLQSKL
jgi:hypothetical protein